MNVRGLNSLFGIFLFAIMVISIVHGLWRWNSLADELHKMNENLILNASIVLDKLFFSEAEASFSVIYNEAIRQDLHNIESISKTLSLATTSTRQLRSIYINPADDVFFTIPNNKNRKHFNLGKQPWNIVRMDSNSVTTYSEIYKDEQLDDITASISRTVFNNDGQYNGLIAATLDLDVVKKTIRNMITPTESTFIIVDRAGYSLFSGVNDSQNIVSEISRQPNPISGYLMFNNSVYYYAELTMSNWFIVLKATKKSEINYIAWIMVDNFVLYTSMFLVICILWLSVSKLYFLERARLVASIRSGRIISHDLMQDLFSAIEDSQTELQDAQERSQKDILTSIWNRARLEQDLRRLEDNNISYVFVMIDIDNFKKINDMFGHPAGDEVLKAHARIGMSTILNQGTIYRYGGEEFAVIFTDSTVDDVMSIIDSWRVKLNERNWRESSIINVSFSAGIVTNSDSYKETIQRADQLLYKAKANGKNQTVTE